MEDPTAEVVDLASRANLPLRHFGSMVLVPGEHMRALLDAAAKYEIGILGIETFRSSGSGVTPDMDRIADFSEIVGKADAVPVSLGEARAFLEDVGTSGFLFDVLLFRTRDQIP